MCPEQTVTHVSERSKPSQCGPAGNGAVARRLRTSRRNMAGRSNAPRGAPGSRPTDAVRFAAWL
jgi:hypothetical protein